MGSTCASAGAQNKGPARGPSSFQSAALPTELPGPIKPAENLASLPRPRQWVPVFPITGSTVNHTRLTTSGTRGVIRFVGLTLSRALGGKRERSVAMNTNTRRDPWVWGLLAALIA